MKSELDPKDDKEQERARFQVKSMLDDCWTGQFTDWEDNFVSDLANRLESNPSYRFSAKQMDVLERIWRKA